MKKIIAFALSFVILIGMTAGCGGGVKTVRVSGRVTFDNEPAKDIAVLFQPVASGVNAPESAVGLTNANGEFSLALVSSKKNGAIPGDYVVYISWVNPNQGNVLEGDPETPIPYKIPSRAKSGQMTFTVPPEGTKEANFDFDTKTESYTPAGV